MRGRPPQSQDLMTEFSNLGLSPTTLQAVADTGYTTATPIQAQAIPVALAGRDVLGIAQTGTGKTAAFTLPMVDRLSTGRARARMPRALVLAPTRELADQVAESFAKYAKGTRLNWALLIGGVSMGDQVALLNKGVDVLIATPGRLLDLFERGKILLTGVEIMVVDEADRMLDMGFIPDIERIFKLTPPRRQTLFFSATMPPEITRLTTQFLKDPTRIEASRPAMTAETITQYIVRIPSSDPKAKRTALRALVSREDVRNGIVFCNRKSEVDIVAKSLKRHGFDAAPIHGDLDQSLRMKTLADFRSGALKILVASDVAARGLDIPDVSHVFNYDVSHHADDYVHRIGRTRLDQLQEGGGRDLLLAAGPLLGVQRRAHEGQGRDAGDLDRILERQEDALGRPLGRLERQQVLAAPGHGALGRLIARPAGQGVAQGRLAGPVRPHDGVHLAGRNVERQPLEDRLVADRDVEIGDGEGHQFWAFFEACTNDTRAPSVRMRSKPRSVGTTRGCRFSNSPSRLFTSSA